jgi:hypothetical protein
MIKIFHMKPTIFTESKIYEINENKRTTFYKNSNYFYKNINRILNRISLRILFFNIFDRNIHLIMF